MPAWAAAPLALIGCGLVLNIAIGQVVRNVLHWPIYLDSIGTIVAGALGGPIIGAATGALSNVVWGLVFADPRIIPYAIPAACIGVAAALAAQFDAFRHLLWAILAGLLTGVIAALISAPISAYLLEGAPGGGAGTLGAILDATSANLLQAATLDGFLSDPFDKAVSFAIGLVILRYVPAALLDRFAVLRMTARRQRINARFGLAVALSVLAFVFSLVFLPAFGRNVYVVFYLAVALSAWRAGFRPAVLTVVVGIAAMLILATGQPGGGVRVEDILNVCMFVLVTVPIALLVDRLERTNAALERSVAEGQRGQAETNAIVEGVVEALVLVAPDKRLVRVNHQFTQLFGVDTARLVGASLADMRPLIEKAFEAGAGLADRLTAAASDRSGRGTEVIAQVWPQARQIQLFSAPVQSNGQFIGRLYGFRDVTQERELDRMKTEFVSQVSHELRTPLTSIKGFTEVLLEGDAGAVNDEQCEFLGIIKSNVDRLVGLTDELLDISRIESGRLELRSEPIDLNVVIELVLGTLRPLIVAKNQTIEVDLSPDVPPVVGDVDRIVQVLTNLVSNAHKYTPQGGAIWISAEQHERMARVAVRDSGIGISPEDVPRLFTRFFRADTPVAREVGGTGLGLAIVKSTVELHGGTVAVESTPGQGSTFSFTLPAAIESSAPHARAASPTSPASATAVLVVDTDRAVVDGLADRLRDFGYQVTPALGRTAALEAAAAHRPDLVVVGVGTIDGHGFDVARELTEDPLYRDIPLLLLSIERGGAIPLASERAQIALEQLIVQIRRALSSSTRQRILVIEDDASTRQLLAVTLRRANLDPVEAPDGETGLVLARQLQPGLILLDLRLPGLDGFSVLQRLKSSASTADIPVVAMTGSHGLWLGARARVLSLGAATFVTKPFELDALMTEIRALTGYSLASTSR